MSFWSHDLLHIQIVDDRILFVNNLYFVYILTNHSHASLYIGVTNNLIRRVYEHKNNIVEGFTQKYNIHSLVYYEIHESIQNAITQEKKLRNLVRRKKDTLISNFNPTWRDVNQEILSSP